MRNIALILAVLFLLPGCSNEPEGLLKDILQQQELVVVTRNAPTTYYDWHDELTGPEYDLTQAFASSLGVEARYILKDTTAEITLNGENVSATIVDGPVRKRWVDGLARDMFVAFIYLSR